MSSGQEASGDSSSGKDKQDESKNLNSNEQVKRKPVRFRPSKPKHKDNKPQLDNKKEPPSNKSEPFSNVVSDSKSVDVNKERKANIRKKYDKPKQSFEPERPKRLRKLHSHNTSESSDQDVQHNHSNLNRNTQYKDNLSNDDSKDDEKSHRRFDGNRPIRTGRGRPQMRKILNKNEENQENSTEVRRNITKENQKTFAHCRNRNQGYDDRGRGSSSNFQNRERMGSRSTNRNWRSSNDNKYDNDQNYSLNKRFNDDSPHREWWENKEVASTEIQNRKDNYPAKSKKNFKNERAKSTQSGDVSKLRKNKSDTNNPKSSSSGNVEEKKELSKIKFNANARSFYPKNYNMKEKDVDKTKTADNATMHNDKPFINNGTMFFVSSEILAQDVPIKDKKNKGTSVNIKQQSNTKKPVLRKPTQQEDKRRKQRVEDRKPYVRPVITLKMDSEQAMSLIEQLNTGDYECMVCCEKVGYAHSTWNCKTCFHLFHLRCIRTWSKSETAQKKKQPGWRCPACQTVTNEKPDKYDCFCGKVENPSWNPRSLITPHSCGEVCGRPHSSINCEHPCTELCHPGPCPSCPVMIKRSCCCGKKRFSVRCGNTAAQLCGRICDKIRKCLAHKCDEKCHDGACEECNVIINQECHCGKHNQDVLCTSGLGRGEERNHYSCGTICDRSLKCGNHKCNKLCHPGSCDSCQFLPGEHLYCHCGKSLIKNLSNAEERLSCLDPIPSCSMICGKDLQCGPKGKPHQCAKICHKGPCGGCILVTNVACQCVSSTKEVPCKDLPSDKLFECERRCNHKKSCGRHRCNIKCCTDGTHTCMLVCGKNLQCGHHKCEELCHKGYCQQCWEVGFEEVSCYCGATMDLPPIQCGASPPECPYPCTRPHTCTHPIQHNCHMDEYCPPCAVLGDKLCMGGHEIRHSIPCHVEHVSCGQPCNREMNCGKHKCLRTCHKGSCLDDNETCPYPCEIPRSTCDHPCGNKCHVGLDCPSNTPCESLITITCDCGRRNEQVACLQGHSGSGYQKIMSATIGNKLRDLQSGQSVDITSLFSTDKQMKNLPCDEECLTQERNRRLAMAFGKTEGDSSKPSPPAYSQFLKDQTKENLPLIKSIESSIEDIILSVKRSGVSQRTHSFKAMSSIQRRVIHEIAKFYDCSTHSQDPEPMRSTTVTATKDSIYPSVRLSTLVESESMPPLPPRPILLLDNSAMTFKQSSQETRKKVANNIPDYFNDDTF